MTKKLIICLLVSLGIIGCAGQQYHGYTYVNNANDNLMIQRHIDIYVDKNFNEWEHQKIMEAVDHWNYCLNGQIEIEVKSWNFDMEISQIRTIIHDRNWMILKIDSHNDMIHDCLNCTPPRFTLAFGDAVGGNRIYVLEDRMNEDNYSGVLRHEIGHLLGAHHKDGGLMNNMYGHEFFACVDKETMIQVKNYNNLDMHGLNYCEKSISINESVIIKENDKVIRIK